VPPINMDLVKQRLAERLAVRGGRSSGAGMARSGPIAAKPAASVKPDGDSSNFQPAYAPVRRAGRSGGALKR
jgi:hypothetical protein